MIVERLGDLRVVVTIEGREEDDGAVEVTVDLHPRQRDEFEAIVLDAFEFFGDDPSDQFACLGGAGAGLASTVVPSPARHQPRSSRERSISRSS